MALLHDARGIGNAERDFKLDLGNTQWPTATPEGWTAGDGCLFRSIEDDEGTLDCPLTEYAFRFPSAPLHGLQRLHEYHVNLDYSENLHTYRVISHPDRSGPAQRIVLLHNGLNELDRMGLYYELASHLIAQDESKGTVCVLRPLPGHLTRAPFPMFAETPLDRYLWDGSHLFRQFIRYMVETQWFLSVLARRSTYRCPSGIGLLAESDDPERGRLDDDDLAREMHQAWHELYEASDDVLSSVQKDQQHAASMRKPPVEAVFHDSIRSLRKVLQFDREHCPRLGGEFDVDDPEPAIHVIGYSLGGFVAQSVFMSWPFMIASCSTLLSGGALRELAPTAFADPEEWQTVLHSLRYELDHAMMSDDRYNVKDDKVAGVEYDLFLYFAKTFYEVFQQDYRGSFQSRIEAFRRRMLFIVGGNDPIVRPKNVLDSGPPGGMNMLMIGGLGHFLHGRASDEEEKEQRSFWIPEVSRLIDRFADAAAANQRQELVGTWLDDEMRLPARPVTPPKPVERLSVSERLAVERDGALSGELFQRCLEDLLARQEKGDGLLFILRNEVPTLLLDDDAILEHAMALHHEDVGITRYSDGLSARRGVLEAHGDRTCVILPWNARNITTTMDARAGHPSQAESAGGQMPRRTKPEDTWKNCLDTCNKLTDQAPDSVRVFDGREKGEWPDINAHAAQRLLETATEAMHGERLEAVAALPDCWMWMSRKFLGIGPDSKIDIVEGRRRLCDQVVNYYSDSSALDGMLRDDALRIVTVSRARYNPRFRGRIIVEEKPVKELLLHASLCIAASVPFAAYDLDAGRMRPPATTGA
jgi:pimeloyl-ACP methyl ester carboxylesterase